VSDRRFPEGWVLKLQSYWMLCLVVSQMNVSVLEEPAASIFRAYIEGDGSRGSPKRKLYLLWYPVTLL